MLLWLSGRCAHLWIDWQGPQHPGDLGDEYGFLIGRMVLPDQFAHPSRPIAVAPSLPDLSVTGWLAGWLAGTRHGPTNGFSEQVAFQVLFHLPRHEFLFATSPGSF